MTVKRLVLLLPALAQLAACGGADPADDSRSASGEVLEGTISDAMLPVDSVRSEPPLEDPQAFAKVRSEAEGGADAAAEVEDGEQPAAEDTGGAATEAAPAAEGV